MKKKLVSSVLTLAIAVSPMTAFAYERDSQVPTNVLADSRASVTNSVYGDHDNLENLFDKDILKQQPLIQSVSPSIGATVVRPDQSIVIQLNKSAMEYKVVSKLDSRFIQAYLLDGKTITPIDKSLIKIDSTAGTVTVDHPILQRYSKYAVVVGLSPAGVGNEWNGFKGSLDVITAVDTAAKTVTLLGKGIIPIETGKLTTPTMVDRIMSVYQVGDAVSTITNGFNGKTTVIPRKDMGASTLFTTGSDLYEPTKVNIPAVDANPSVLADNDVVVTATDDYGLPAKAAITTSVTEQGSRLPSSANLVDNPVELTNGSAKIILSNHEAEQVQVRVEVGGSNGTKIAETQLQYQPGPTEKLEVAAEPRYTVGAEYIIEGTAKDLYDNPVKDGVQAHATSDRGVIEGSVTAGGNFKIKYKPSTQKGNDSLRVSTSDSGKVSEKQIYNKPDAPVKATVTVPALKIGKAADLTGTVVDQYGNGVEDTAITLDGVTGTATTDADGKFTVSITPSADLKEIGLKVGDTHLKMVDATGAEVDKLPVTVTHDNGLQNLKGSVVDGVATEMGTTVVNPVKSNTVWGDFVTPPSTTVRTGFGGDIGLVFKDANSDTFYSAIYQGDSHFVIYKSNDINNALETPITYDNFVIPYSPSTDYRIAGEIVNGVMTATIINSAGKSSTIKANIPVAEYNNGYFLDKDGKVKKMSTTSAVGMDGYAPDVASVLVNGSFTNGYAKDYAVDKNFTTAWNAGGYSGWLQLNFKNPETFSAIQLAAPAMPTTLEDYSIQGLKNGVWKSIGALTTTIYSGNATVTPHILVIEDTYDAIKINVNGRASWVAINEVHLIK